MIAMIVGSLAMSSAQSPPGSADLRADIEHLRRALRELHPGVFRYRTVAQEAIDFESLKRRLERAPTRSEAYLGISEYLAGIRCGHTFLNPYNQSEEVRREFYLTPRQLPFHFRWIEGRMIVTVAMPGMGLHPGDEIIEVNGRPISGLRNHLLRIARADGARDASRLRQMSLIGREWEELDAVWPLICPPEKGEFRLKLPMRSIKVPAVKAADRRLALVGPRFSYAEQWSFTMRPDGKAIMRLNHFVTWRMQSDWKAWMQQCFEALRQNPKAELLLDLRECEGGSNEPVQMLASFMMDRSFSPVMMETRSAYQRVPLDLRQYLRTWDDSAYDLANRSEAREEGGFRLKTFQLPSIGPFANAWKGKVTVAIDEANTSGGFLIAWLFQQSGRVTLVGGETGGSRQGLNAGQMFFLTLPKTGFVVDVPIFATFPVTPQPEAGIVPDLLIPVTQASIASGRDPVVDAFFNQ